MDEHREEREELAALAREDAAEAREDAAERLEWATEAGLSWAQFVTVESELWAR